MGYIIFYLKRAFKSRLTWGLFFFVLLISFYSLYQNSNEGDQNSLQSQLQYQQKSLFKTIYVDKQSLRSAKKGSEKARRLTAELRESQKQEKEVRSLLRDLKDQNYTKPYQYEIKSLKNDMQEAKQDEKANADIIISGKAKIKYYRYLMQHNLADQGEDSPVQSWTFLIDFSQYILPIILSFTLTFILVENFSRRFKERIDIEGMFPAVSKFGANISQLLAGLVLTFALLAGFYLVIILITGVTGSFGSFDYPIRTYVNNHASRSQYVAAGTVLAKSLILQLLFLISLTQGVQLIVRLLKNNFAALFTSLLITVALPILPFLIVPMASWAQWLPTTYLFSTLTVTGNFGSQLNNAQLTFNHGVLMLSVVALVLLVFAFVLDKMENIGRE